MRVINNEHPFYTLEHDGYEFGLTYIESERKADTREYSWEIDSVDGEGFEDLVHRYNLKSYVLAEMIQEVLNKENV
jgi:hypothetical protein